MKMLGKVLGVVGAGVFIGGVVVELLRTGSKKKRKKRPESQESEKRPEEVVEDNGARAKAE